VTHLSEERLSMSARLHGLRAVFALLGVAGVASSHVLSGCGTSGAAPTAHPVADSGGYVTVVTAGGGPVPEGGATVIDTPIDSGSSSGGSSGDAGSADSAGDGDAAGCPADDASNDASDDVVYTPPQCGVDGSLCDLHSNTCCLNTSLVGTCLPGACASCPSNQATVHCLQAGECTGGASCCGDVIRILGEVKSHCVPLVAGQSCPYVPWTSTQLGVQLCKTDTECKNGQPCIHQMCQYGAVLDMCGVQDAGPLNCSPIP
jgi:hypothetical protein